MITIACRELCIYAAHGLDVKDRKRCVLNSSKGSGKDSEDSRFPDVNFFPVASEVPVLGPQCNQSSLCSTGHAWCTESLCALERIYCVLVYGTINALVLSTWHSVNT